jgi:signal transduction histidine kinase
MTVRLRPSSALRRLTASVRVRSTIAGTGVILVGSIAGSLILLILLQRTLTATVEDNADTRAAEVVRLLSTSSLANVQKDLAENTAESQLVQVVDSSDQVVASSSVRASSRPLSPMRPKPGTTVREQRNALTILRSDDPYLITAVGVTVNGGNGAIIIASTVAPQSESIETLVTYLLILIPAGGVLVAAGMWILVGRSLRPVEAIRSRVASIRSGSLDDRVPVPNSHDEVARLALTMNEMLERLDTGQRMQRAFVSDASHELRSPLATLSASLDVVGDAPTPERWTEVRDVMSSEVDRMTRLVDDLLLLAKADDHGLAVKREQVDLDDVVDVEVRRLRARGAVEVTASISAARVRGDRSRLAQVVRNIVENAAVAAQGHVRVRVFADGTDAVVTVEDDGNGIPEAQRSRVFERFVRLDDSRSRDRGGSGLGLAIVHEIVAAHGGTVEISDSSLGGACFDVRLPMGPAAAPQTPLGSSR